MAGGGAAFSQSLQSQDETNMGSGEPVVRYGTGGRISGFANGGNVDSNGVVRLNVGGDDFTFTAQDGGGGAGGFGDSYDFGGDFGGGYDFGSLDSGPGANNINDTFDYNREGATPDGAYIDNTTGQVFDPNDDVPEIVITTDRPESDGNGIDSLDIFNPNDILDTNFIAEDDDVPEIIVTTDRPIESELVTDTISVTDLDTVTWETETDSEDVSEIIITTDRPTTTPLVTDTISVTDLDTVTWVTETDTEDITEIIITTDRPTTTPLVTETDTDTDTVTSTVTETDTDTVTETDTETETETIFRTDAPTFTPRPTYTPLPTLPPVTSTPLPTNTPAPRQDIYRSQYQNYADPLTMFNVSNYGQDVPTSAGYNFATGSQGMGIAQLNQNLRDMADRQMAQTYPNGLPRGADMNAVLAEMRRVGLTATDLENARYGRTTGLNTPFSQYNKEAPTARTFGGGIAELIKNLPK
jgi:hypothetical protein